MQKCLDSYPKFWLSHIVLVGFQTFVSKSLLSGSFRQLWYPLHARINLWCFETLFYLNLSVQFQITCLQKHMRGSRIVHMANRSFGDEKVHALIEHWQLMVMVTLIESLDHLFIVTTKALWGVNKMKFFKVFTALGVAIFLAAIGEVHSETKGK